MNKKKRERKGRRKRRGEERKEKREKEVRHHKQSVNKYILLPIYIGLFLFVNIGIQSSYLNFWSRTYIDPLSY